MYQLRTGDPGRHGQVDPERAQGRIGPLQLDRIRIADDPGLEPGFAEAVHPHVQPLAQTAGQILDMHPGTAIDVRGVLPGEQIDPHQTERSR